MRKVTVIVQKKVKDWNIFSTCPVPDMIVGYKAMKSASRSSVSKHTALNP